MFTHPGAYDEHEYHSLPQDTQTQPPYLEGSPEFYSGMMDQKYAPHYQKNHYTPRGKRFLFNFSFLFFPTWNTFD